MKLFDRITVALAVLAVSPNAWLALPILFVAACLIGPVLLAAWLLLKLAEALFAKPRTPHVQPPLRRVPQLAPPQKYFDVHQGPQRW